MLGTGSPVVTSNHPPGSSSSGSGQGYDTTNVDVSAKLADNQTRAAARGTTTGDQYLINALAPQINVGAPIFPVSTKSANLAVAKVGDIITYTVAIDNHIGTADATNVVFRDPFPTGLSYVPSVRCLTILRRGTLSERNHQAAAAPPCGASWHSGPARQSVAAHPKPVRPLNSSAY